MSKDAITIDPTSLSGIPWDSADGMMLLDDHRRVLALNRTLERWTGVRSGELHDHPVFCGDIIGCRDMRRTGEDEPPECPGLVAAREGREVPASEYTLRSATGTDIRVCASYVPTWEQATGRQWIVAVLRDVSLQRKTRLALRSHEDADPVTGLLSAFGLFEASEDQVRRSECLGRRFALARLTLPDLLSHEQTQGPLATHELLQSLVSILKHGVGRNCVLAHTAPAELAVLVPRAGRDEAIELIAGLLPSLLGELGAALPGRTPQFDYEVSAFPKDGDSAEALMAAAHVTPPSAAGRSLD